MLKQSVFIADCLCGHHLKSPTRECVCPDCHRLIVFDGGRDSEPEDKPAIGRRPGRGTGTCSTLCPFPCDESFPFRRALTF